MLCINGNDIPLFSEDLIEQINNANVYSNEKGDSVNVNLGNDYLLKVFPGGRFTLIRKGNINDNSK